MYSRKLMYALVAHRFSNLSLLSDGTPLLFPKFESAMINCTSKQKVVPVFVTIEKYEPNKI